MDIIIEERSGISLVTLSGRCEGFDYLDLQKKMDLRMNGGEIYFVLDVTAVEYISSTSLATICSYLPDCEEKKGGIVFLGASERVLSILECLKITAIIPVVDSFSEALSKFGKS